LNELDADLQRTIEALYRLESHPPVSAFRVGPAMLDALLGPGASQQRRESLLVDPSGDDVGLGVYIADDVMGRAHRFFTEGDVASTSRHLDEACVAIEGVSHYVYLNFCGGAQDRPVSQIEMELQGEIDKFVLLRTLTDFTGEELLSRLFEGFALASHLSDAQRARYIDANRLARRYARWLDRRFAAGQGAQAMEDARHVYRKPLASKVDRISRS
jgi:hypothetical protein